MRNEATPDSVMKGFGMRNEATPDSVMKRFGDEK
jgi:hypothetical protein